MFCLILLLLRGSLRLFLGRFLYLVKDDQLILGPFQGSTACYRIHKGKGVVEPHGQKLEP